MTLGERLRKAREFSGLDQIDLAARSGVSQQIISKLETGKQKKSTDIVALALACGVRPEWLALEQGPMIASYTPTNPRLEHALKIMESLPPEALDYVIQDIDKTAELIEKMKHPEHRKRVG